jgi:hypothetical protein
MTGIIVDVTGSFKLALLIGGCSILLAAVIIIFVVPELKILESLNVEIAKQEEAKAGAGARKT